jgi:dTDP-4-dehydrorhamnose reductase
MKRILIFGGTGMLGHTLFTSLSALKNWDVYASVRTIGNLPACFSENLIPKIRPGVDADNFNSVVRAIASVQPNIVINCIGLIKQLPIASDPLIAITINSQFPHRLSLICCSAGARLIHISTDCVFDGQKGNYKENDPAIACDLYGRTKFLGEVVYPHCVTLRTSIIGHELKGFKGLIEWFLRQNKRVQGYTNAFFSGLPTIELASLIGEYIIPNEKLKGIYHVSSEPISKFELLKLTAERYEKKIQIEPYDDFKIDRSLDSSLFKSETGYSPPSWSKLVDKMYDHFISSPHYRKQPYNKIT